VKKKAAIKKLRGKAEITRFKGLGEISPHEFEDFIGKDIKLDPVIVQDKTNIEDILSYYMGKNSPERQEFIIANLKIEVDEVEEAEVFELAEEEAIL
jgi:topoisomerase IV subunit B